MDAKKGLIILVILLLLGLLGLGYWGYNLNTANKALSAEKDTLNGQVGDLTSLRDDLQQQVDSLEQAYASLSEENKNLQGKVDNAETTIASQSAAITKIKKQNANENGNLKAQIEELLKAKLRLEGNIAGLQAQNDSLRAVTGQLTTDLASAKSENQALADLNKTIQDEMKKLTLANFKASAFRVEVERKKPKATAKAGRARRILVSFDLMEVKQQFAVQQKDTDIVENQRLTFNYELEDKLKSGYYRVAVYTDIGLLGASSFRLQ
ncbi:MAG: hypothetical protein MUC59_15550 [Saprospiraceae bacterium]|nr:hypothetical protein [Saprospiraceae bacterium]